MRKPLRSLSGVLAIGALVASGAPEAPARDTTPAAVAGAPCEVVLAEPSVNAAALRRQGQIPSRWPLALDSAGKADLEVATESCTFTLAGRPRPVLVVFQAAKLDSAKLPSPERHYTTSSIEGVPYDLYALSLSANDREMVDWLRAGTGMGDRVQYVPGLAFHPPVEGSQRCRPAHRRHMARRFSSARRSPQRSSPVSPVVDNVWTATPLGSVKFELADSGVEFGLFTHWSLTTDAASPLGVMLGGGQRQATCTPDQLPQPLLSVVSHQAQVGCLGLQTMSGTKWSTQLIPGSPAQVAAPGPAPLGGHAPVAVSRQAHVRPRHSHHRAPTRRRPASPAAPAAASAPSSSDDRGQCARYASLGVNTDACAHDLAIAIAATAKYRDINVAKAGGYAPLTDCTHSPLGGMGVHYGRVDLMVVPHLDLATPQLLTYFPSAHGWRLGAAEYEQTAFFGGLPAFGQAAPANFNHVSPAPAMFAGKKFDGPMAGHSPIQPWHYDLHVWVGIPNPAGVFAPYNPSASC